MFALLRMKIAWLFFEPTDSAMSSRRIHATSSLHTRSHYSFIIRDTTITARNQPGLLYMTDLILPDATVLLGDCIERMSALPDRSVQMCVTSPPYFGLRDYGVDGQIGLEETPEQFIARLVDVFREVRRVIADDGTCWINIGDSYGPRKQLLMIPARLALALQSDGWILRQRIIWHKPNPMPESVTDRCTNAYEDIFLLAKAQMYFFDHEAIKEPATCARMRGSGPMVNPGTGRHDAATGTKGDYRKRNKADSFKRDGSKREQAIPGQAVGTHRSDRAESTYDLGMRNKRNVWSIATRGYKGAHFAVFPPALVEPCILAGSRTGDVVLDPFNGSGTTGQVALQNGRRYVGVELNPEYLALTRARLESVIEANAVAASPSPQSDLFAA